MKKVRLMGEACAREAELALRTVKKNRKQAEQALKFMKGYQLLSRYYERKVLAGCAGMIYKHSHKVADKAEAEKLADKVVACHRELADYLVAEVTPILQELHGRPVRRLNGPEMPKLVEMEEQERARLGEIFGWPKNP